MIRSMRDIDVRTVDPATLENLENVHPKPELPCRERKRDYIRQIGNPYCFILDDAIVKLSFPDNGPSLIELLLSVCRKS